MSLEPTVASSGPECILHRLQLRRLLAVGTILLLCMAMTIFSFADAAGSEAVRSLIGYGYVVGGLVDAALFVPQIRLYYTDRGAAAGISLLTWAGWSLVGFNTVLYAALVNGDGFFLFVVAIDEAGNLIVLCLGALARLGGELHLRQNVGHLRSGHENECG